MDAKHADGRKTCERGHKEEDCRFHSEESLQSSPMGSQAAQENVWVCHGLVPDAKYLVILFLKTFI